MVNEIYVICKKNEYDIKEKNFSDNAHGDIERATSKTGFGLFNVSLILLALPSCLATVFDLGSLTFVLPMASNDLHIQPSQKGLIYASISAGTLSSGLFWGYLTDIYGRREILIYGHILQAVFSAGIAISKNFYSLFAFTFLCSLMVPGPQAARSSYLSEFHATRHGNLLCLILGSVFCLANALLPIIAWAITSYSWSITLFDSYIFKSWNAFLLVSPFAGLLTAALLICFPESPKFLVLQGKSAKALKILQKAYSINKIKPRRKYPITHIRDDLKNGKCDPTIIKGELVEDENIFLAKFKEIKFIFIKPYLIPIIFLILINFGCSFGEYIMRSWGPELFRTQKHYQKVHVSSNTTNICDIVESSAGGNFTKPNPIISQISDHIDNEFMYKQTTIANLITFVLYIIVVPLVRVIGCKIFLVIAFIISGFSEIAICWANNATVILTFYTMYISVISTASAAIIGYTVKCFPTSMRTTAIAICLSFGKLAGFFGNLLFLQLVSLECTLPFMLIACIMFICCVLCIFMPNEDKF